MTKKKPATITQPPGELEEGLAIRTTQRGYKVIQVHFRADPSKRDPEWEAEMRKKMPDTAAWQREYGIDWSATSGRAFYQDFVQAYAKSKTHYIREIPFIKGLTVYRGWDFGYRNPACVWIQISNSGRVGVLREFTPSDIDIHSFRDSVLYLSGQIPWDDKSIQRRPKAKHWIQTIKGEADIGKRPEIPWFPEGTDFVDFSGPEATAFGSIESEKGEVNDLEVLASRGIQLTCLSQRVTAGERIIRRMLSPHPDGKGPGIIFHPSCERLIDGFAGGLTFKKGTSRNPLDDSCAKDGVFEHIHDALRYVLVGAVPLVDVNDKSVLKDTQEEESMTRRPFGEEEQARREQISEDMLYASVDNDFTSM